MNSTLKIQLGNGEAALGTWVTLGDPAVSEIFCMSGFDFIVIDLEHSSLSIADASRHLAIANLAMVPALVRLTSNDPNQIKRVMDAGASGIIVPMINCMEEAVSAVQATRYYPNGVRGVGLSRAQGFGENFSEYLQWQKTDPVVIVQIEHVDALANLSEIFSAPGIDGYFVGPYDLSNSLGVPGDLSSSIYIEAMDEIWNAGVNADLPAGIHVVEPDPEQVWDHIKRGYKLIAYSVDFRMLSVSSRNFLKKANARSSR